MMRVICALALVAIVAGCHDSTAPREINGTYLLRSYRDLPLPQVVSEDLNHTVQITAGTITINGDLTFTDSYTFERNDFGTISSVVVACTGHWTPAGESPQGGELITLDEASLPPGCGDHGIAEWDHNRKLTIAWNVLGLTQHRR
jgi:hypothetical protein